jgi:uncharacterized protein GlcG (DUF336 family)
MLRKLMVAMAAGLLLASTAPAHADDEDGRGSRCTLSALVVSKVQNQLLPVTQLADQNGGLFKPNRMWSAVVDREGHLCSIINTNATNGDAWPGSRAIAIAKAETANDFSNSALALSTANLYGPTQPDGSLYGLNNSNPFNPVFDNPDKLAIGKVPGGIITFGGGVALYSNGQVIGGLGVSGDTSCADHAIAYRMRRNAGFDKIPGGAGLNGTDNIIYETPVNPADFAQPHCTKNDITP